MLKSRCASKINIGLIFLLLFMSLGSVKSALLVLPAASILMVFVNLILRPILVRAKAAA